MMNPDCYREDVLIKKLCADVLMDHDSNREDVPIKKICADVLMDHDRYREDVPMKRIHLISTLAHRTHQHIEQIST